MKAIILAGGFATRLWPLTEKRAKPLLLLQNKALISHIVESLPENIDIIISTNRAFEDDFIYWKKQEFPKRNIEIFIEDSERDKEKVGALGAIALIIEKKKLEETIMVFAGDNYFGFSMQSFIDSFEDKPLLAAFDIKDTSRAKSFGVVVSKDGKHVDSFEEKPENPSSTLVSTGAYIFPQRNLEDIQSYARDHNDDLGGIFEYLQKKKEHIQLFSFDEHWFDVGSFIGYLEAHVELQKDTVLCSDSANIDGSDLLGSISIAENCVVENSLLENVILFPNTIIKNATIRNCIIDSDCLIEGIDVSSKIIRESVTVKK